MKKILFFILSVVLLNSCSNEMLFDTDMVDAPVTTRASTSDKVYYFGASDSDMVKDFVFSPKDDPKPLNRTLRSYVESDGVRTFLQPEIMSKPSWVNYCICSQYNDIYVLMVVVDDNTSSERSGNIVLKQPESNKILSIGISQNGVNNYISIGVNKPYKNRYEFTATTTYPVKEEIWARVPLVVYNDSGEMTHNALIVIAKGQTSGSYLMDWNGSPLVVYNGDLKGYRLYEGTFSGDNIYTYSFVRYW